jgi:hypothetical protein
MEGRGGGWCGWGLGLVAMGWRSAKGGGMAGDWHGLGVLK